MKKLILSIILGVFIAISSYAEEDMFSELPSGIWWEQIPAVCVPNEGILEYTKKKELQALNKSFGRTGGKPDGEIVYIITYWVNIHTNESMATVMTPGSVYSCVLFRSFDLQLNPYFDWKEKIDT